MGNRYNITSYPAGGCNQSKLQKFNKQFEEASLYLNDKEEKALHKKNHEMLAKIRWLRYRLNVEYTQITGFVYDEDIAKPTKPSVEIIDSIVIEVPDRKENVVQQAQSSGFVSKTSLKSDEELEAIIDEKARKHIHEPSLMRRMVATFTDLAIIAMATLMLWAWAAQPVAAPYEEPYYFELYTHQLSSGLTIIRDPSTVQNSTLPLMDIGAYFGVRTNETTGETTIWNASKNGQPEDIALGYEYAVDAMIGQIYAFYHEYIGGNSGPTIPSAFVFTPETGDTVSYNAIPLDRNDGFLKSSKFRNWLSTDIHGDIVDISTYFSHEWFNYRFLGLPLTNHQGESVTYRGLTNPQLFEYEIDSITGEPLTNEPAKIKSSLFVGGQLSFENQKRLFQHVAGDNTSTAASTDAYTFALSVLSNFEFYKKVINSADWIQVLSVFVCLILAFFVFLFIIPLACPNGESLGFWVTRTMLLRRNDYRISRWQTVMRQSLLLIELLSSILSLGVLAVVWILILIFGKKNKTLHDMFAGTKVIEKDRSIWFNTPEDEQIYRETVAKDLEYLRDSSRKVDSPSREYLK